MKIIKCFKYKLERKYIVCTLTVLSVWVIFSGYDFKAGAANRPAAYELAIDNDTTVCEIPAQTADLKDAVAYFGTNNRFKDWDKNDPRKVILQGVVEKDGTITNVRIIKSSNIKKLDDEALRLIKSARYNPGKNNRGETVRCKHTILVPFPAK